MLQRDNVVLLGELNKLVRVQSTESIPPALSFSGPKVFGSPHFACVPSIGRVWRIVSYTRLTSHYGLLLRQSQMTNAR